MKSTLFCSFYTSDIFLRYYLLSLFSQIFQKVANKQLTLTINFVHSKRITLLSISSSCETKWKKTYVLQPQGGFLMSGIRVCVTDQDRFFTSKNPEQAPNFEILLQNRPYFLKFYSRTGFFLTIWPQMSQLKRQKSQLLSSK